MEPNELADMVTGSAPGTRITYYQGFLMIDRDAGFVGPKGVHPPRNPAISPEQRSALISLCNYAWALMESGLVYLVQKRVAPMCWDYIAIVRQRPVPPLKRR